MDTIMQDVRYGVRTLIKNPMFTLVAALALAIGIGANSAIFSVVDALLVRPLAYKDADRLVFIWHHYPRLQLAQASISPPSYIEYRDLNNSFEQVAAGTTWSTNLTGAGDPEHLEGAQITYNLFATLGVEPTIGRSFLPEEDRPGSNDVVILSDGLWHRRFGGDPQIVHRTINLDGRAYTVVGVLPPGFRFLQPVDVYTPIGFTPDRLADQSHGWEYLVVVARLKPGITFAGASADMDALADNLRPRFYQANGDWGITVVPLREQLVGDFRAALLLVFGAVGCVLLIACANVANLLLARASSRNKEVAIRMALGASRVRIVRQLLTESVLLSSVGGVIGLAIAYWSTRALVASVPEGITGFLMNWDQIGVNASVLGFTLVVCVATGIAFGLAPALQCSRPDLNDSLKEGGRSGNEGSRRNPLRSLLVVFEIAVAVILLVGSGLLIKSFIRLREVNPGFDPSRVLTMQLSLPKLKYSDDSRISAFFSQMLEQVGSLSGVEAAAVITTLPMSDDHWNATFFVEGLQRAPDEPAPHGDPHMISPDYFKVLRIPLLRGRYFTDADTSDSMQVCIVDQTLADQYWPDQDPIGKRIAAGFEGSRQGPKWRSVVGVVGHVKSYGIAGKSKVQYYFPESQSARDRMNLVLRTKTEPTSLTASVRDAIARIDPDQPVHRVGTMEQIVANSTLQKRFLLFLFGSFSAVALLLAAIGVYGVVSYSVSQRTHEIGIRMALGASSTTVIGMVVKQGLVLTVVGLSAGLGSAYVAGVLLGSALRSQLFSVGIHDPITFAAIALVLGVVALMACFIPARRATRIDPMVALRYE